MASEIATELQMLVRQAAAPVAPGETVAAQMRKSWERLGRPAWWRIKACWYAECGGFSAQAARDIQTRFLAWRESESRRATSAAETERTRQAAMDKRLLEELRTKHLAELAKIETRLMMFAEDDA